MKQLKEPVVGKAIPAVKNQAFVAFDDVLNTIRAAHHVDLRLTGGLSHPWDVTPIVTDAASLKALRAERRGGSRAKYDKPI